METRQAEQDPTSRTPVREGQAGAGRSEAAEQAHNARARVRGAGEKGYVIRFSGGMVPHAPGTKPRPQRHAKDAAMPDCPKCSSEYAYQDGALYVCPECAHEWNPETAASEEKAPGVRDSNGNALADGDSVMLIKDLKLKGSSTVLKKGAKAKNIRLVDGDHEIDCRMDDMKVMLKAEFVKKC